MSNLIKSKEITTNYTNKKIVYLEHIREIRPFVLFVVKNQGENNP